MLAELYADHRPALRASFLSEYGVADVESVPVLRAADLAAWLPAGSAVWRSFGGPLAWSEETHLLNFVEHRLRVLAWLQSKDGKDGKKQPKPMPVPELASKKLAAQDEMQRKAAAYRRRQPLRRAPS